MSDDWQKPPIKWSLIVPANNEEVLAGTLLSSPDLEHCQLILKRNPASAATAFNEALDQATGDVLVLAHQDVYLPLGWWAALERAIRELESADPNWGVLGPVGVGPGREVYGYVYSTGLQDYVGEPFARAREVISLDEMVLVLRRAAGLRFDERLPGFHLYGTDICLEAASRGMKCYAVPAFCLHNSVGISLMPRQFWSGYRYLRGKWRRRLPIPTCCTEITRFCVPMLRRTARDFFWGLVGGSRVGVRHPDPESFYREVLAGPATPPPRIGDGTPTLEFGEE